MKKTSSKLVRAAALLSASTADAVERCGTDEKRGVFVRAILLVLTPIFGFVGTAYAVHDIVASRSQSASVPAPTMVLLPVAAGLVYAFILFSSDWLILKSLDGCRSRKRRAAVAAPGLLLAAFCAFLISVPLNAFLFEDEVGELLHGERGAAATEVDATVEHLGLVGKFVALERLAAQSRETGLLVLGIFALTALILASPVLVGLMAEKPAPRTSGRRAGGPLSR